MSKDGRVFGKNWTFTLNNYTDDDLMKYSAWVPDKCSYVAYSKEVGEEGTPHLQGYASVTKKNQALSFMKKLCPRAHWEVMMGTFEHNEKYCSKQSELIEFGELSTATRIRQTRSKGGNKGGEQEIERWKRNYDILKSGTTDGVDPDIYIRYTASCDRIALRHAPKLAKVENPDNVWFWGTHGTGKTHAIREHYGDRLYDKPLNKWWDAWNQEDYDCVLIDEMDQQIGGCLTSHIKKWADKYPVFGEAKGTFIHARPPKLVVCSNHHPKHIWKNPADCAAIMDRFRIVQVVGESMRRQVKPKNIGTGNILDELLRNPDEEDNVPEYDGPLTPLQVEEIFNPTNN